MAKLTTIEGIGDHAASKLKKCGCGSVEALLRMGGTKKGRESLSRSANIAESKILRFVNHADLMRIKGIGGEYSELLEASGVDSVPELKQRNPSSLHATMTQVNGKKRLVRQLPNLDRVSDWVKQAKSLPRAVSH